MRKTRSTLTGRTARQWLAVAILAGSTSAAWAGAQIYEPMAASTRAMLSRLVSDSPPQHSSFTSAAQERQWLEAMSPRLAKRIPDREAREELLQTVHYEATRAGLDPQMVLGLVQVESAFRKYAVSSAGARGFMQVMPFWIDTIGDKRHNLFHMRTNLRYGCTILRHYVDIENGNLFRALGRYNGSLGRPEYPNLVKSAWYGHWLYDAPKVAMDSDVPVKKPVPGVRKAEYTISGRPTVRH